ncbi:MAG: competence protein ComEC [Frankiales bacterium]|jgi:competence protein ComEC|nr:competence protein ComEC [Frankiales bacterium]
MSGGPTARDVRLIAPAGAAWLGAVLGGFVPLRPALCVAGLLVLLAPVACLRRSALAVVVAVALASGAAAIFVAGIRSPTAIAGSLTSLADRHATVVVAAVVRDDPQVRRGRARGTVRAPTLILVAASTRDVRADTTHIRVRVPILIIATGPGWTSLLPSQHVTVAGRLTPAQSSDQVAATLFARGPPEQVGPPSLLQRVAGRLRAGLRDAAAPLPSDERGLLPGLVDGDVSRLNDDVRDNFRTTGLTHLTAVSGANVAIVAAAALGLARAIGLGLRGRAGFAALAVLGFVILARPSPSVLRAAAMGLIGLAALTGGRRVGLPVLSATVLVLVLVDPALAITDGFALSVLATGALLTLAPHLRDRIGARARWAPQWTVDATAVALAAQIATAPYIALRFARLSLISVVANLLAAPAVAPATILGVLAAVLAPVVLPVAHVVGVVAGVPTGWLVVVARIGADLPGASIGWPRGATGLVALLGVVVAAIIVARRQAARRPAAAMFAGVIVGIAAIHVIPSQWPPRDWAMVVCDVGQGDAVAVRTAPGEAVLFDTGPDPVAVDRCLRKLGVRRLPLVLLTHFHADHVEGLPGVLRHRAVGELDVGPLDEPPEEHLRVATWAKARRIPIHAVVPGELRSVGAVTWEVVAPMHEFRGTNSDPNNSSIVARVSAPGFTAMLTGDVEPPAQADLLDNHVPLQADFLKIPHHGSSHQEPQFLAAVQPRIAVASVGAGNSYGHPAASTLEVLRAAGAQVFRTDHDGGVAITMRSGKLVAMAERGRGSPPLTVAGAVPAAGRVTMALCARRPESRHSRSSWATRPSSSNARLPRWLRRRVPRIRTPTSSRSSRRHWLRRTSPCCSRRRCSVSGASSSCGPSKMLPLMARSARLRRSLGPPKS